MRQLICAAAAIACAAAPLPAAPPPAVRQPTAKWVLEYADTHCTALRSYGTPEAPLTLAFRLSPRGGIVRLMLARPGRSQATYHFPVTTNITQAGQTTGLIFPNRKGNSRIVWINLERAALEGLRSAGMIAIKGKSEIDERFAVPGIGAVLDGLDRCNADLRKHWNMDDAGAARLSRIATSVKPIASLVSDDDYPSQAAGEAASGTSGMILMVDEAGTLKDCMVEEASGVASLDAMACGILMERAKFQPALDTTGKPLRSVQYTRIRWVMPTG